MDLVISFKKQRNIDNVLLEICFTQYNKHANFLEDYFVIGDYKENELKELISVVKKIENKINKKITILNTNLNKQNLIMPKFSKIYFQVVEAGNYIKQLKGKCDILHAHTDVIPFKDLTINDLNKEVSIRNRSLKNPKGWFEKIQLKSIKKFEEIYGNKKMYIMEHHYFYYINDELLDFLKKEDFYLKYNYSDIITNYFVYEKNINIDNLIKHNLITTTFKNNKYVCNITDKTKAINFTLPENKKSIKLLNKIIKS